MENLIREDFTATDKLFWAARLVEEVLNDLDTNTEICAHCGKTSFSNRSHALLAKELEALIRKLKRFAGSDFIKELNG